MALLSMQIGVLPSHSTLLQVCRSAAHHAVTTLHVVPEDRAVPSSSDGAQLPERLLCVLGASHGILRHVGGGSESKNSRK